MAKDTAEAGSLAAGRESGFIEKKKSAFASLRKTADRWYRTAEKICPEKMIGDSEILERKLAIKYSGRRLAEAVRFHRQRNVFLYTAVLAAALTVAAVLCLLSVRATDDIGRIHRPESGQGQLTIPMIVEAQGDGASVRDSVSIIVREEKLSDEEKDRILDKYAAELPEKICPETGGRRVVTEDFSLPLADEKTGVLLTWESSDPVLISEDGRYDVLAMVQEEEVVTLTAHLVYGGREREVSFDVILRGDPALYQKSISRRIEAMTDEISAGEEGSAVELPSQIGEKIRLRWKKYDTGNAGMVAVGGIMVTAAFIFRRYSFADREVQRYCRGIVTYFPPFIDKLVLLLNSGLTVMTAMEKIAEDCRLQFEYDRRNMLAYEAAEIGKLVKETNASVVREWHNFAARTGINEIMRFSTIIEDNLGKGTSLAEKLEIEGNLLREKEKKSVQEKMRMIDSKLTLPLILMLFSLVLVTVAPAMMQM